MWSIIAVIVAIAIFAKLSFIFQARAQENIRASTLKLAVEASASSLATFARASRAYSQANNSVAGTTISVATLTGASMLPSGFNEKNTFDQTLEAKVGANPSTIVAYYKATANTDRFGMPSAAGEGYRSVQFRIAANAVAPLATVPGVLSGIASGALITTAAPYTQLMIPGSSSGMSVNTPAFTLSQQNAVVYLPGN